MGCAVNGPGEARDADLGIAAGNKRGHLFVRGTNVAVVPEDEMVDTLVEWAEYIVEHGVDAALARVDTTKAKKEAEAESARSAAKANEAREAAEQSVCNTDCHIGGSADPHWIVKLEPAGPAVADGTSGFLMLPVRLVCSESRK